MAEKHRQSVIGGHNHLFAVTFDRSGEDIACNLGYTGDSTKWRYQQEKVTPFPTQIHAFGAILTDSENPHGRFLPMVNHPRWAPLEMLYSRFENYMTKNNGGAVDAAE